MRFVRVWVAIAAVGALSHGLPAQASSYVQWKEEVKLNDGRVIVVTQKRRCEGGRPRAKQGATCLARESWLTVRLPRFSSSDIVWNTSLKPFSLNLHEGRLYLVARAPYPPAFREFGATNPPYFGFLWDKTAWRRIPFSEIPLALYDANMLIENVPGSATDYLDLAQKDGPAENGDPVFPRYLRRIDPNHKALAH